MAVWLIGNLRLSHKRRMVCGVHGSITSSIVAAAADDEVPQGSWRRSSSKKFSSIVTLTLVGDALESGTIANCLPSGAKSKFVNAVWCSRCLDHTRGLLASNELPRTTYSETMICLARGK